MPATQPTTGQFVSLRGRLWLVEGEPEGPFDGHRLACVDDDASGESARVLWAAEVDARLRDEEAWASLGSRGGDDPGAFAAYLRTVKWRTATAAERDLFQAPFRAGIRLDPYQLLPLRKALRLPRVNLLIADDVGLGKTVEAGLVLRELMLRRRADFAVVLAPAAMTLQWQEELRTKFGLAFEIVDRAHLEELRRRRGWGANPWAAGARFIMSHALVGEEAYVAGLRDVLGPFRPRALLILDEAHHAAPAGGGRYAIESQFTRSLRELTERFEHRLFLSATPHNGHPNSFATLLELLDPQRFTRGVEVRAAELEPVMVRRLKGDLRALGEAFPERRVEAVAIDGLPADAPELRLAALLADYRALRERRVAALPRGRRAQARLAFVGLQQRLLSSVPAFANTLAVHLAALDRLIAGQDAAAGVLAEDQAAPVGIADEEDALARLDAAEASAAELAARAGAVAADRAQLLAERGAAAAMLAVAEGTRHAPDARVRWLLAWVRAHLQDAAGRWGERRLILFTEYEDTRRWLGRQLEVLLSPDDPDEARRIDAFTGVTSTERREAIKRAFNDPAHPLRILVCTDAAREGINLQAQCHDLVHVDLPWNPARLEQRNGRVDRKLQPSAVVTCRYFHYRQRPEDIVLDALVRKTELIRRQLGSAGQVLGDRVADRLTAAGIGRGEAAALAERIRDEQADERVRAAARDLGDADGERLARLRREQAELAAALAQARRRVGVDPRRGARPQGLRPGGGIGRVPGRGVPPARRAAGPGLGPLAGAAPDDPRRRGRPARRSPLPRRRRLRGRARLRDGAPGRRRRRGAPRPHHPPAARRGRAHRRRRGRGRRVRDGPARRAGAGRGRGTGRRAGAAGRGLRRMVGSAGRRRGRARGRGLAPARRGRGRAAGGAGRGARPDRSGNRAARRRCPRARRLRDRQPRRRRRRPGTATRKRRPGVAAVPARLRAAQPRRHGGPAPPRPRALRPAVLPDRRRQDRGVSGAGRIHHRAPAARRARAAGIGGERDHALHAQAADARPARARGGAGLRAGAAADRPRLPAARRAPGAGRLADRDRAVGRLGREPQPARRQGRCRGGQRGQARARLRHRA